MTSTTVADVMPIGEGAGYAGGIISAALEGFRAAGLDREVYAYRNSAELMPLLPTVTCARVELPLSRPTQLVSPTVHAMVATDLLLTSSTDQSPDSVHSILSSMAST